MIEQEVNVRPMGGIHLFVRFDGDQLSVESDFIFDVDLINDFPGAPGFVRGRYIGLIAGGDAQSTFRNIVVDNQNVPLF